jgi:hypothetical protein
MLAHMPNNFVDKFFMDAIMKKVIKLNKIKNKLHKFCRIGFIYPNLSLVIEVLY